MTDEQLYEIEKRAYLFAPISIVPLSPRLAEWISAAGDDRRALLAEVSRLRVREAALLAVAVTVATADYPDTPALEASQVTYRTTLHTTWNVVEQARALVSSKKVSNEND